jgi:hypothetical protein
MEKSPDVRGAPMGHGRASVSPLGLESPLGITAPVLFSPQHNAQLFLHAFESTLGTGGSNLA